MIQKVRAFLKPIADVKIELCQDNLVFHEGEWIRKKVLVPTSNTRKLKFEYVVDLFSSECVVGRCTTTSALLYLSTSKCD